MKNLTVREIEILKLILEEVSTIEIASRLGLSKRTVDTHRRNIIKKTSISNVIGLFKYALKHKLIEI
jgi:DNA-binding CsgD family transcriptional regulator